MDKSLDLEWIEITQEEFSNFFSTKRDRDVLSYGHFVLPVGKGNSDSEQITLWECIRCKKIFSKSIKTTYKETNKSIWRHFKNLSLIVENGKVECNGSNS